MKQNNSEDFRNRKDSFWIENLEINMCILSFKKWRPQPSQFITHVAIIGILEMPNVMIIETFIRDVRSEYLL